MAKRPKIGICVFNPDVSTGGYYYSLNLIKSALYLNDKEKPHLVIFFTNTKHLDEIKNIGYPYLSFLPYIRKISILEKIINKFSNKLGFGFLFNNYPKNTVSFVYPCEFIFDSNTDPLGKLKKVYWIPDFQEKYYPDFFNKEDLENRDNRAKGISKTKSIIAFSSNSAATDYSKYYPNHSTKVKILRFTSIIPAISSVDPSNVLAKYGILKPYFISPNQFWIHKNHQTVLDAALLLKQKGIDFNILFTGKEYDYRDPEYTNKLKSFVAQNHLQDSIRFLGFIDRIDQLVLMKNSISIIQPSLFEGWSTVVEDTKAINHRIILSDLPVHLEQINENVVFFERLNPIDLAEKIEQSIISSSPITPLDYSKKIEQFAKEFANLCN